MKTGRNILKVVGIILMFFILSSCIPKQEITIQTFLLQQSKITDYSLATQTTPTLYIDKVTATPPFDALNFIFKTKPTRYQMDYYLRFLIKPSEQLHTIFISKFSTLPSVNIVNTKQAASYLLNIKLNKFYIDKSVEPRQAFISVSIQLVTNNTPQKVLLWRHYQQSIPIQHYDAGAQNIVLAWNSGIHKILQDSVKQIATTMKTSVLHGEN